MINVTKSYLPNINKYKKYVEQIYKSNTLTNNGPLTKELTIKLQEFLDVKNLLLVSNGTLALQIAYKVMGLSNSVITTPFSFIASVSSLVWENLNPKFVDINREDFNISITELEENIIKHNPSAIVPVHVFGNSCRIKEIDEIAKKHNIKVIYDASHTFGVKYQNEPILKFGDVSTISFHATKLFHTAEGGALVIKDDDKFEEAKQMINFGYETGVINKLGINAKMNEFSAALGLCVLDDMNLIYERRKEIWSNYYRKLRDSFDFQKRTPGSTNNYSYFPVLFKNEKDLLKAQGALNKKNIYPRRYFHPSLDTLDFIKHSQICKASRDIASRILCLPIFFDLQKNDQEIIIDTLLKSHFVLL